MSNKDKALNQVIAIEKGVKTRTNDKMSTLYKQVKKPDLFTGFNKKYEKRDEDGEDLPPEKKQVQIRYEDVLNAVRKSVSELLDITATKDFANCKARADVVVDGKTILNDVPSTHLLFLEKQLNDMHSLVKSLPVLSFDDEWYRDENTGFHKSEVIRTHRTKKVEKPIVMYDATDKHPAQTSLITKDELVGYWATQKHSGACPNNTKDIIIDRVNKLLKGVKMAREEANSIEAPDISVGDNIFGYLFDGIM